MRARCWFLAVLLAGCTTHSTTAPVPARVAGWRADVDAVLEARDHVHPDGWHGQRRADWLAAAAAVKARIGSLDDDAALVEVVRLAAMPGWSGRDGHSGVFPFTGQVHAYPLRWWRFPEGLVITAARAPYGALVGARVEAVAGVPVAQVLRLVEPLAPRDNASNLLAYAPLFLRSPELLHGLGITDSAGPAVFTVVDRDGVRRYVRVAPVPAATDNAWTGPEPYLLPPRPALWLRRQAEAMWWTYLPASGTLYVQLNRVEPGTEAQVAGLLARARQGVERVVLDLRHDGGGDNRTLGPLEAALADPAIDRRGRLFVLVGRATFSAAANLATDLERTTSAVFAGEPLGGSPNLYGDATETRLPWGGQSLYTATRYWQRSEPGDPRVTIDPDLPVALTAADYFHDRDPVLRAVTTRSTTG